MSENDQPVGKRTRKEIRLAEEKRAAELESQRLRSGIKATQPKTNGRAESETGPNLSELNPPKAETRAELRITQQRSRLNLFEKFTAWLTDSKHSLMSMALLRIIYGTAMFWFLATNYSDRHYLWGEASNWIDYAVSRRNFPELFDVFPKNSPVLFDSLYVILMVLTVAFTLGLFTRMVTPVLFVLWVGLSTNSVLLTNGGDVLMRITLAFFIFASLNEFFSLDNLIKKKFTSGKPYLSKILKVKPEIGNAAHNTALILALYQVSLVYVNSGILKLMGEEWRNGTALYYALSLDVFMPFPWLSSFLKMITPLIFVGTFISIWAQLLFPILVVWRRTRYLVLIILTSMHLGIALLLGLWPFSMAMIALDLLFIGDKQWKVIRQKISGMRKKPFMLLFSGTPGRVSRNSRI